MDRRMQAVLLLAIGVVAVRFGVADAALAYVKPSLQPLLLAAGAVLVLLGGHSLVRGALAGTDDPDHGDPQEHERREDEAHGHAPGVAWLLAVPLLVVLLVAPPALGSFAVGRQGAPAVSDHGFVELPAAREGAVELGLRDFVTRALHDPDRSLDGVPVRVVGFVVPLDDGGYTLSRFTVACCAADATAYSTRVAGDAGRAADTWVEIVGRWEPGAGDEELPVLAAERVTVVPAPAEPYEY